MDSVVDMLAQQPIWVSMGKLPAATGEEQE